MKYISVQPVSEYYAWQLEVMLNNFIDVGIKESDIQVLGAKIQPDYDNSYPHWERLVKKWPGVGFYFYEDTRQQPVHYTSSIRPNILKQHFRKFPELFGHSVFYHDCDIVFTKSPEFEHLFSGTDWYVSDTNSYINYDYIKSKGHGVYEKMCEIVGINEETPKRNNTNSGGAQYIMKRLTARYWNKVEWDSEQLFKQITELNNGIKKENPKYHELQIWCADMWAVLWNAWLFGHSVKIAPELAFCWATDAYNKWYEYTIYHNAGVAHFNLEMFNKMNYINVLPHSINLKSISKHFANYHYAELVKKYIKNESISYNADIWTDSIS